MNILIDLFCIFLSLCSDDNRDPDFSVSAHVFDTLFSTFYVEQFTDMIIRISIHCIGTDTLCVWHFKSVVFRRPKISFVFEARICSEGVFIWPRWSRVHPAPSRMRLICYQRHLHELLVYMRSNCSLLLKTVLSWSVLFFSDLVDTGVNLPVKLWVCTIFVASESGSETKPYRQPPNTHTQGGTYFLIVALLSAVLVWSGFVLLPA